MNRVVRNRRVPAGFVGLVVACVLGCTVVSFAAVVSLRLALGSFTVAGNALTPISRGGTVPLDVGFTNRYDFPIAVTNLRVTVRDVLAPHADAAHPCTVDDFVVHQFAGDAKFIIGARATGSLSSLNLPGAVWPQVGVLSRSANQDACKGATLTLGYTASKKLRIL